MDRTTLLVLLTLCGLLQPGCGAEPKPGERTPPELQQPAVPESTPGEAGVPDAAQDPRTAELEEMIRAGKKIEAIKLYREIHGVGLRDAKDAVDAIAMGLSTSK